MAHRNITLSQVLSNKLAIIGMQFIAAIILMTFLVVMTSCSTKTQPSNTAVTNVGEEQTTSDSTADRTNRETRGMLLKELIVIVTAAESDAKMLDCCSAYSKLFSHFDDAGLKVLLAHSNDSVAIQTAWHFVNTSVEVQNSQTEYQPDIVKLRSFMRLVEKRCRVKIPQWWQREVMGCKSNGSNIYAERSTPHDTHTASKIGRVASDTGSMFVLEGMEYRYHAGDNQILLPKPLVEKLQRWSPEMHGYISGAFSETSCFLYVHDSAGSNPIVCLNKKTSNIDWVTNVCGEHWGDRSGLFMEPMSELVLADDGTVFSFAILSSGFCFQGNSSRTGKTTVRFSTGFEPLRQVEVD